MTEGDWEEDHEKLAEITEQSRIRHNSYNNDNHIDSDDHTDLDLEASISQLVLEDCDDPIVENGEATKPQSLVRNVLCFIQPFACMDKLVNFSISQYLPYR
jgi:hypothetical protein